jgi:peptidase E
VSSNLTPISRNQTRPLNASIEKFAKMLNKSFDEAKNLFIPTAAQDGEGRFVADFSKDGLYWLGILPENLTVYDIDGSLTAEKAMTFDVIYFTGGWDSYLLNRVKQTGFDKIVKKMVYSNKVYIGQNVGTVLATT